MKRKNLLWISFAVLVTIAMVPPISYQESDPNSKIYMDKPAYEFESPPTAVGDKFNVTVFAYNITRLHSFQVVLDYNATLLNCTNAWPNKGWDEPTWVFYGVEYGLTAWIHQEGQPTPGRSAELVGDLHSDINGEINLTGTEGLMARFELEILANPQSSGNVSSLLSISSSWGGGTLYSTAADPGVGVYPVLIDSLYLNTGIPAPKPVIKVEPENYTATYIGETFDINVTINIDEYWRMVGVQFRLSYSNASLEVLEVTEGPFVNQFPTPPYTPGNCTVFMDFIEEDGIYGPHVLVGIQLIPNATGQWTVFPNGSGTLATITFNATSLTPLDDLGLLDEEETFLTNDVQEPITAILENGQYQVIPEFPISIISILFPIATSLAVALRKMVSSKRRSPLIAKPKSNG